MTQVLMRLVAQVRNIWRALTSMGTALVLLFLLALGAIPGALLPQRSLNVGKVDDYLAAHPVVGPWLNQLQAFDVFSSFWFTAICVLLFVSLVGCLTSRMIEHARSLRAAPVVAPRNLTRLPKYACFAANGDAETLADILIGRLRGWRIATRTQDGIVSETVEVSAEKGYLREFGNLVFHFSLLGLLVAVAVGKLFGYEGSVVVIADGGPGFCSASPAAFDSFHAGNTVDGTSLHPLCIRVNAFTAHYLPSGQATSFAADIDYQDGHDLAVNSWRPYRLEVNHPLRVAGDWVYLQGHGYAPTFTVIFPDGQTRTSTVQWRPDNSQTLLSSGVARIDPPAGSYPNASERRRHEIAIQGLLAPTEQFDGTLLSSRFPALNAPAVAIDIYCGDTGLDSGRPQSLFTLDPRLIDQGRLTEVKRVNLRAGEQVRLDPGLGSGTVVRFDGAVPFVNLQVSHDPGQFWVLVFAIAMMAGLVVSLVMRRRRVWVRLTPAVGTVNVELGGLARTDNSGWGDEFERLVERLLAGLGEPVTAERTHVEARRSSQVDVK
ncbi:cytochrome C biogenesis protein ResB [Mycobacterium uberis]|uniref:Cytochrome C biogenesis protein ResB n=1 Tax=Mycobacterium uberis TaxID=2162698 RepID=A0A3E1HJ05_9MYCO|nr:cytochrome C biogenesis protein ResB [Mycobacterium uberis]